MFNRAISAPVYGLPGGGAIFSDGADVCFDHAGISMRLVNGAAAIKPPTSSAGLASGTLWNNNGSPAIVP